jgi:hypothetical protein
VISADRPRQPRLAFWITLVLVTLATGALLILLPQAGSGQQWTIHWLPGTGAMGLGLGETGFYATLVTVGACLLVLVAARTDMPPATSALTLLALLGGAVALLAEHFLLRYVALEIVALCVALAPLADVGGGSESAASGRWARLVYLVLRVGDAGLLVGIAALWGATGTLEIAPALEAGLALPAAALNWIVGGLLLAVWVKVGGWPLHVWQQAGEQLTLFSRSWLYRTLTPNLGLYLLYRVTPLIAQVPLVKAGALWVGALGAGWAAVLAVVPWWAGEDRAHVDRLNVTMTCLFAAQGGLALLLAGMGLKTTVWLAVIVLTPLRVLLSLAGESALEAARTGARQAAAALYGLGGLALVAFNAWMVWWVREAGLPLGVRLVAELAVGLIAAWAVITTLALWRRSTAGATSRPQGVRRWIVLAVLAGGLVAAILWRMPLLEHLAHVSRGPPFTSPTPSGSLRFLATSPTGWGIFVLALWIRRRVRKGGVLPGTTIAGREPDWALELERGLRQGARVVHAVVEAGALRGTLAGITKGVQSAAYLCYRWIEGEFLEGTTRQIAQTAIGGGRLVYRAMEQRGLEGLLRRIVRAVMAGSRWLQRRHTGRLRRNLIWVVASLALAVLGLILYVW